MSWDIGLGDCIEMQERSKERFQKKQEQKYWNSKQTYTKFNPVEMNPDVVAYNVSGAIKKKQMRENVLNKDLRSWF